MNKWIGIGNWCKDTELSYTANGGKAVLKGVLAVEKYDKSEGGKAADFINIIIWDKKAESTANYCGAKGNKICICGRIQTRSYDAKDGTKRYVTEVVAQEVEFLNAKSGGTQENKGNSLTSSFEDDMTPVDDGNDIPFN